MDVLAPVIVGLLGGIFVAVNVATYHLSRIATATEKIARRS